MRRATAALAIGLVVLATSVADAQELPDLEPGVATYVPILDSIVVDGDLSDWATVPSITTATGPTPAADPANTGSITWQIASTDQMLLFAATVVDATIVAGQHGDNYWNEDSVELYLNFSGNPQATQYGAGIGQLTVSPVDIGNVDPGSLTITGNNASEFDLQGYVFATDDGWGLEVGLSLAGLIEPVDGSTFGLQVQANGSSGGDRDTKLIWSAADVDDVSFTDPSVFGTGVFAASGTAVDDAADQISPDSDPVIAAEEGAPGGVVHDAEAPVVATVDEPNGNRALLIAAIASATSIMVGGFWFEHRRKAFEAAADPGTPEPLAIDPAADDVLRPPPVPDGRPPTEEIGDGPS